MFWRTERNIENLIKKPKDTNDLKHNDHLLENVYKYFFEIFENSPFHQRKK